MLDEKNFPKAIMTQAVEAELRKTLQGKIDFDVLTGNDGSLSLRVVFDDNKDAQDYSTFLHRNHISSVTNGAAKAKAVQNHNNKFAVYLREDQFDKHYKAIAKTIIPAAIANIPEAIIDEDSDDEDLIDFEEERIIPKSITPPDLTTIRYDRIALPDFVQMLPFKSHIIEVMAKTYPNEHSIMDNITVRVESGSSRPPTLNILFDTKSYADDFAAYLQQNNTEVTTKVANEHNNLHRGRNRTELIIKDTEVFDYARRVQINGIYFHAVMAELIQNICQSENIPFDSEHYPDIFERVVYHTLNKYCYDPENVHGMFRQLITVELIEGMMQGLGLVRPEDFSPDAEKILQEKVTDIVLNHDAVIKKIGFSPSNTANDYIRINQLIQTITQSGTSRGDLHFRYDNAKRRSKFNPVLKQVITRNPTHMSKKRGLAKPYKLHSVYQSASVLPPRPGLMEPFNIVGVQFLFDINELHVHYAYVFNQNGGTASRWQYANTAENPKAKGITIAQLRANQQHSANNSNATFSHNEILPGFAMIRGIVADKNTIYWRLSAYAAARYSQEQLQLSNPVPTFYIDNNKDLNAYTPLQRLRDALYVMSGAYQGVDYYSGYAKSLITSNDHDLFKQMVINDFAPHSCNELKDELLQACRMISWKEGEKIVRTRGVDTVTVKKLKKLLETDESHDPQALQSLLTLIFIRASNTLIDKEREMIIQGLLLLMTSTQPQQWDNTVKHFMGFLPKFEVVAGEFAAEFYLLHFKKLEAHNVIINRPWLCNLVIEELFKTHYSSCATYFFNRLDESHIREDHMPKVILALMNVSETKIVSLSALKAICQFMDSESSGYRAFLENNNLQAIDVMKAVLDSIDFTELGEQLAVGDIITLLHVANIIQESAHLGNLSALLSKALNTVKDGSSLFNIAKFDYDAVTNVLGHLLSQTATCSLVPLIVTLFVNELKQARTKQSDSDFKYIIQESLSAASDKVDIDVYIAHFALGVTLKPDEVNWILKHYGNEDIVYFCNEALKRNGNEDVQTFFDNLSTARDTALVTHEDIAGLSQSQESFIDIAIANDNFHLALYLFASTESTFTARKQDSFHKVTQLVLKYGIASVYGELIKRLLESMTLSDQPKACVAVLSHLYTNDALLQGNKHTELTEFYFNYLIQNKASLQPEAHIPILQKVIAHYPKWLDLALQVHDTKNTVSEKSQLQLLDQAVSCKDSRVIETIVKTYQNCLTANVFFTAINQLLMREAFQELARLIFESIDTIHWPGVTSETVVNPLLTCFDLLKTNTRFNANHALIFVAHLLRLNCPVVNRVAEKSPLSQALTYINDIHPGSDMEITANMLLAHLLRQKNVATAAIDSSNILSRAVQLHGSIIDLGPQILTLAKQSYSINDTCRDGTVLSMLLKNKHFDLVIDLLLQANEQDIQALPEKHLMLAKPLFVSPIASRKSRLNDALINGHTALATWLVLNGAPLGEVESDSRFPLLVATQEDQIELVELMLDIDAQDKAQLSDSQRDIVLYELAVVQEDQLCLKLIQNMQKIEHVERHGNKTALFHINRFEVVKAIFEKAAKNYIHIININNDTFLQTCLSINSENNIKLAELIFHHANYFNHVELRQFIYEFVQRTPCQYWNTFFALLPQGQILKTNEPMCADLLCEVLLNPALTLTQKFSIAAAFKAQGFDMRLPAVSHKEIYTYLVTQASGLSYAQLDQLADFINPPDLHDNALLELEIKKANPSEQHITQLLSWGMSVINPHSNKTAYQLYREEHPNDVDSVIFHALLDKAISESVFDEFDVFDLIQANCERAVDVLTHNPNIVTHFSTRFGQKDYMDIVLEQDNENIFPALLASMQNFTILQHAELMAALAKAYDHDRADIIEAFAQAHPDLFDDLLTKFGYVPNGAGHHYPAVDIVNEAVEQGFCAYLQLATVAGMRLDARPDLATTAPITHALGAANNGEMIAKILFRSKDRHFTKSQLREMGRSLATYDQFDMLAYLENPTLGKASSRILAYNFYYQRIKNAGDPHAVLETLNEILNNTEKTGIFAARRLLDAEANIRHYRWNDQRISSELNALIKLAKSQVLQYAEKPENAGNMNHAIDDAVTEFMNTHRKPKIMSTLNPFKSSGTTSTKLLVTIQEDPDHRKTSAKIRKGALQVHGWFEKRTKSTTKDPIWTPPQPN